MAGRTLTYLYCLARGPRPRLARCPPGLPGTSAIRLLEVPGRAGSVSLWLVVGDAPTSRFDEAPLERGLKDLRWVSTCAMAHEAIVEHVSRQTPALPFKLFTLFAGDERALAHVRLGRPRFTRLFTRLSGRKEWGLRVRLDEGRARASLVRRIARVGQAGREGAAWLRQRQREWTASRELAGRARGEALRLFEALSRKADEAQRREEVEAVPGGRVLLDAVFLVPERRAHGFAQAVEGASRRLADDGFDVSLTGPWPPYHFLEGRLRPRRRVLRRRAR
ncbi:MAG: GvpL/GvpF family gas vesicle protein [Deltaproteobacteria bacterium]